MALNQHGTRAESMGVWKRTLVFLGLVEEDELSEREEVELGEYIPEAAPVIRKISREEMARVRPLRAAQPLGQVGIVTPRVYDDAQEIGDKIKAGVPVIINLQGVEDDLFKRLTSFAAGLAYGLSGDLQKIAPRMYLITPENVEVSAEDRQRLRSGLFNEF